MMYDDLIELMKYCANDNPVCEKSEICPFYNQAEEDYGYYFCVERMLKQAADAIEELQTQLDNAEIENIKLKEEFAKYRGKNRWIPVTERLPDVWKHVITFDEDDGVRVNWRCGDNVSWSMGYHVTHWMPLPEPPKDGEA